MDSVSGLFANGGPITYLVLLLALTALAVAPILGVVAALRVRLPALAWLAMPVVAVAVGIIGRVLGHLQMRDALLFVAPEQHDALLFAGLSIAPLPEWLSLWSAAVVLSLSALMVGLGAVIGAGKEARWTWAPGVVALVVGGLGWLGITGWAVVATDRPSAVMLVFSAILLVGGMGIVAAGLRLGSGDRDAWRTAAARGLAASCTVLALGAALMAARMDRMLTLHDVMSIASPEHLTALFGAVLSERAAATRVGLAAMAVATVAGAIPALAAARSLLRPYALISAAATLLVLGLLGGLHAIGEYQARGECRASALMRSQELASQVSNLPAPPDGASENRVTELDAALWWNGDGWTHLPLNAMGTEFPSMEYAGPQRGLLAMEASTPARVLVDPAATDAGREPFPPTIDILTRRPATEMPLASPYLDWTQLGAVEFLWCSAETAAEWPPPVDSPGVVGEIVMLSISPESDRPTARNSVFVLDGGGAPGAADLGLDSASNGIFVVAVGAAPREIPPGDDAARQLAEAVEILDRPYVVFLPADNWTVQDLVTLCLTAVPPRTPDSTWTWDSTDVRSTCAVDRVLPFATQAPRMQVLH